MTPHARPHLQPRAPLMDASPEVADAVEQGLGALLSDRDVGEVASLEGGMLQVVRRGRRQRLDARLEGPLFALLHDALAASIPVGATASDAAQGSSTLRMRLRGGHVLTCAALADGRLALRVVRAPVVEVSLDDLVQEGLLPAEIPHELVAAARAGTGVLVLGTSRSGRQRVLVALARAVQDRYALFGLTDELSALLPVPLPRGAGITARALAAAALGADALCALDLAATDVAALAQLCPGPPLLASVAAPTVDALEGALEGVPRAAVAGHIAVVGHGPDGEPRLLEMHGPPVLSEPATDGGATDEEHADLEPDELLPAVVHPRGDRGRSTDESQDDTGVPALEVLPAAWASDAPDDDPGWELAGQPSTPPTAGSFDAALASQKQRPSFAPHVPPQHPQARTLQARGLGKDPFGGLTFEPPPGGPEREENDP